MKINNDVNNDASNYVGASDDASDYVGANDDASDGWWWCLWHFYICMHVLNISFSTSLHLLHLHTF